MIRNTAGIRSAVLRSGRSYRLVSKRFNSSSSQDLEQEQEQVSLADLQKGHKGFFDYTWGRWMHNDEHERAIRKTEFSIEGLLDVMKEKVDYLSKSPANAELQIRSIGPIHEGKHHKIYKVELVDGRSYVLRIPYQIGLKEYRKSRMQSEVATMDFLKKKHSLLMPNVSSWSPTADNRLGCEYMLLDFVAGDTLMHSWQPGSMDLKAKSVTIKPIVDSLETILTTEFNKFGSLYFTEDVASEYQNDLPYDGETDTELADRWRIGPTTESRFWKGRHANIGAPFRGPFESAKDYLQATADVQLAYIEDDMGTRMLDPALKQQLLGAKKVFEWYSKLANTMFNDSSIPNDLFSPRLHNPDLNPINIIHRTEPEKTYVLDFENTAIRPWILHGSPSFVRNRGPKVFKKDDIPNYDQLSEAERKTIDHFIAQTQNQFAFEFLIKSSKVLGDRYFPAFSPNLKRREELVETALRVDSTERSYMDLEYDILKLSQEWQFVGVPDQPFPIEMTDEEFVTEAEKLDQWNIYVTQNPFTETKGWVPIALFEELLGRGIIVKKENGNYALEQPLQGNV